MFERFTQEARRAVVVAQEEARGLGAGQIEPVHLLLALSDDPGRGGEVLRACGAGHDAVRSAVLRLGTGLDADALSAVGIDLGQVQAAAEAAFGPGALTRGRAAPSGHIPFAEGSRHALTESLRYVLARKEPRRERSIDSGAVLAGVLAVEDPTVGRVLRSLGADREALDRRLRDPDAA